MAGCQAFAAPEHPGTCHRASGRPKPWAQARDHATPAGIALARCRRPPGEGRALAPGSPRTAPSAAARPGGSCWWLCLDDREPEPVGTPERVVHTPRALCVRHAGHRVLAVAFLIQRPAGFAQAGVDDGIPGLSLVEIGRASCRGRVEGWRARGAVHDKRAAECTE